MDKDTKRKLFHDLRSNGTMISAGSDMIATKLKNGEIEEAKEMYHETQKVLDVFHDIFSKVGELIQDEEQNV